jgi:hypothetical protein
MEWKPKPGYAHFFGQSGREFGFGTHNTVYIWWSVKTSGYYSEATMGGGGELVVMVAQRETKIHITCHLKPIDV